MKVHYPVWAVCVVGALTVAAGCKQDRGSATRQVVNIGLVAPLTGNVADLGREMMNSAKLAAREASEKHPDFEFRIVARDDQTSATGASTAATGLAAQRGVLALVGAGETPQVRAEIEALKGLSVPLVTSTATASDLSGGADYVFRVIPANAFQGEALAELATGRLQARKVAIIYQQNDYALDLKKAFSAAFKAAGGEVTAEVGFETDETDFRAQLDRIRAAKSEAILCAAQHVPVGRVVLRAREMGLSQPILAGETAYTDKFLTATRGSAANFYVTGPALDLENPPPALQAFLAEYHAAHDGKPGMYGCYTYDAVGVLADAIVRAGGESGQELLARLRATKGYEGVTGTIAFDSAGEVPRSYKIYTVVDGKFVSAP